MQKYLDRLSDDKAMNFIKKIEVNFKNAPHLPEFLKDFLVNVAPWFALIGMVLSVIGVLQNLNLIFGNSVWAQMVGIGTHKIYFGLLAIYQAITAILLYYAYQPLKSRKLTGWIYMFWLTVLGMIVTAVSLLFNTYASLVWTIIGAIIGFYVLFELKPYYSKKGQAERDLDPDNPNSK